MWPALNFYSRCSMGCQLMQPTLNFVIRITVGMIHTNKTIHCTSDFILLDIIIKIIPTSDSMGLNQYETTAWQTSKHIRSKSTKKHTLRQGGRIFIFILFQKIKKSESLVTVGPVGPVGLERQSGPSGGEAWRFGSMRKWLGPKLTFRLSQEISILRVR